MPSTTDYGDYIEGTLISALDTTTTTGVTVKASSINGSAVTWPTGAHRLKIVQKTQTTTKVEKVDVASASQSGSTVTLGTLTRALPFGDGTDFTGSATAQSFAAGARVFLTWDVHDAEQTPKKDISNTFSADQTISGTNKLQLNDSATYIYDNGTNLIFKDSANSETTLSTLAASGNDEKVGVDSGATPDYLGSASNDGVLRTGDGLSYTDGGDFVTIDVTKLKDASATELTISSGSVTATGSTHKIDTESDASSDDLDTISGGADGDFITLFAENDARTVVVKHGTGNILTTDNADFSIDTDDKAITLRYDGTNWKEVSRADNEHPISFVHASTADQSVSAGTYTSFGDSYTISANTLSAGDVIHVVAQFDTQGSAFTGDWKARFGGTDILEFTNSDMNAFRPFIEYWGTVRSGGATGDIEVLYHYVLDNGTIKTATTNISSVDFTSSIVVDFQAARDSGGGSMYQNNFIVTILNS